MSDVALTDIEPDELEHDAAPGDPLPGETARQRRNRLRRERYAAERDAPAEAKPPKAPKAPKTPKDPKPRPGTRNLTGELQVLIELAADVWTIRDDVCGPTLNMQAHDIAAGLNAWAQRDPKVYAMLVRWTEGGGVGALAMALWPMALVVANHHVLPAIERRRELLEQRRQAFEEQWEEPEPLIDEANVPAEATAAFIPPNVIPDGR